MPKTQTKSTQSQTSRRWRSLIPTTAWSTVQVNHKAFTLPFPLVLSQLNTGCSQTVKLSKTASAFQHYGPTACIKPERLGSGPG